MATEADLLGAFEVHSPTEIATILAAGVNPLNLINGKRPVDCLIEGYLSSPRFVDCLSVMLQPGRMWAIHYYKRCYWMMPGVEAANRRVLIGAFTQTQPLTAFTCCRNVTALHVCAEFNSIQCGKLLIDAGVDVNARSRLTPMGSAGKRRSSMQ